MPRENSTGPRPIYPAIFLAAGLFLFIHTFSTLAPILLAFILILLLSLAINPVIMKLRRLFSGGRVFATGFVLLVFLAIIVLTGFAFYHPTKRSASKFFDQLPQYWERIQRPVLKIEQKAVISEQRIKHEVTKEVARENGTNAPVAEPPPEPEAPQSAPPGGMLRSGVGAVLGGVTGSLKSIAANAASIAVVIITVFFGVIFTLLKPRPVIRVFYEIIPEKYHERTAIIARRIAEIVPRWALATLLGMTIIGCLIFLVMWPLLGFQDALVLGLIALVFEAVPFIGPILAAIPALLLAFGHGGLMPLWVLLAYICVQALENNVIMPVVVGGKLQLHPVGVIFSMLFCATLFGVLGVLISLPMLAIFIILYEELYRPRFLPNVSEEDLTQLAQATLEQRIIPATKEKPAGKKATGT